MELTFEVNITNAGKGSYPDLIHFANTQAQLFDIEAGSLRGTPTEKVDNGEWDNIMFRSELDVSPDYNMSHFEVKMLSGFGIIGCYKTDTTHKLIIYEFAFEMDRYLNNGRIKHSIDSPVSSLSLSLENADIKNPERPGYIVANERTTLLSPGAKIELRFGAGNDYPEFDMGTFFVDRSSFTLLKETVEVEGRNTIGKVLKDQTLDESNVLSLDNINKVVESIFEHANLENYQYLIENTAQRNSFEFDQNTDLLAALQEIFKATINWKVAELYDGTIVVGSPSYAGFEANSTYQFSKGKDIFSRQIERDDSQTYRRVCVHDKDYNLCVYREAATYSGWDLQTNKTYHVEVPEGTKLATAINYANELASRLADVGKIETFTGPFRPQLIVGDAAVIQDGGNQYLGLITEITHSFGKNGFDTSFTVDSGGLLGKGRLSDYISQITKTKATGSIGYEE